MLTEQHIIALQLLESKGFPRPNMHQLKGWCTIGSMDEGEAEKLLTDLVAMGFAGVLDSGRYEITETGKQAAYGMLFAD